MDKHMGNEAKKVISEYIDQEAERIEQEQKDVWNMVIDIMAKSSLAATMAFLGIFIFSWSQPARTPIIIILICAGLIGMVISLSLFFVLTIMYNKDRSEWGF